MKELVPTYRLAQLEVDEATELRHREPDLGDAIVDWDRTFGA